MAHRHHSARATAAIGCALLLAACGSSSNHPSSGGSGQEASLVKFSECMRAHGVSGFPDPSSAAATNDNAMGIDGYTFNLPAGMNLQSPRAASAQKTCGNVIGGGNGPPRSTAFAEKAKQAAIARAQCMRDHGVPNYPDPKFSSSGGTISVGQGGPGLDPRSPAFQQAQKICQRG